MAKVEGYLFKKLIQRGGQKMPYDLSQGDGGGGGSDEMWSIHCN